MQHALVETIWRSPHRAARAARTLLFPMEAVYGASVALRRLLYDRGVLRARELALPTVSVGNLTVGGTGKTPLAAWLVAELTARGARPAVALRDYGGDEALVHAALNPGAPVVVGADRVHAVARARGQGADVAVLDDAFQHRRARRDFDIVLISADTWRMSRRLLPAGPWREPLSAVRRATVAIVTRKASSADEAADVWRYLTGIAPQLPLASVSLAPKALVDAHSGAVRPLGAIDGRPVLAVAGIADPAAFRAQLERAGGEAHLISFADHYAFTERDATRIAQEGQRVGQIVCTLKDAVKLAPIWPRGGPALWYLSQQVILERGRRAIDQLIGNVLEARARFSLTAG